ncbi:MAG: hypothetical protein FD146_417 [Anaerolineaceae bacterium]|nr:MAG: hypothetical protein FD146_417 [Anaerolineaceae bacterium]
MTLVRLGNLVHREHLPKYEVIFPYEGLEGKIFPDHKHDSRDRSFYYVSRNTPEAKDDIGKRLGYKEGQLKLDDFENKFLRLLVYSDEPLICLSGHMGCGKSSLIRYIIDILTNGNCSLCDCIGSCQHRNYIVLNFNRVEYPKDEKSAKLKMAEDISFRVQEALQDTRAVDEEEELTIFWEKEISNLRDTYYTTRAFVALRHMINTQHPEILGNLSKEIKMKERKDILKSLLEDPEFALDYYFHLWRYTHTTKFEGQKERFMVFFDNIDNAPPATQTAFVQLLMKYTIPGINCIVAVRPETFEAMNLNRASGFMEYINHEGPQPHQVVCYHLNNFLRNPEEHYAKMPDISREKLEVLSSFFSKILAINSDRKSRQFEKLTNFFKEVCGPSIRLGLKLADGLLMIDNEIHSAWAKDKLTLYHVVRGLISRGNEQFKSDSMKKSYHPIENVFEVRDSNENGHLLVKSRILQYLAFLENGATVKEIREVLSRFGYSETDLLRLAINDLIAIQRQLIRSTDRDGYLTAEEFQGSGASRITITDIGRGYLRLIGDIDYLQEVMLDCRVPVSEYPQSFELGSTDQILILISKFLRSIFEHDKREIQNYLDFPGGFKDYLDRFGTDILSWKIFMSIYSRARRIIYSELNNRDLPPNVKEGYQDALGRYDKLLIDIRDFISQKLSIQVRFPAEYDLE